MLAKSAVLAVAAASAAFAASESGHHWSYSGASGPTHWEAMCRTGRLQSPINIRAALATRNQAPALAFAYKPTPLHIVDNGHTIQVNVEKGSSLSVGGVRFPLVQFHFHRPGEEAIDGHRFAMVAHLVHRDAEGNLAVVAVPLQTGAANPVIATLWRNLPHQKGHEASPAGVAIDPSRLLPSNRSYFTYVGSLTTPPCTEGVRWFVLDHPVTVSSDEIAAFAKLYPANARPLQPANGRQVLAHK